MYKTIEEIIELNKLNGRGYSPAGLPRAFTSKEFFDISVALGNNQLNPDYRRLFENFTRWCLTNLKFKSALEIGCGPGYLVYLLNKVGIECVGVDGNSYSHEFFKQLHPEIGGKYFHDPEFDGSYGEKDVFFSIECFEHIPDEALNSIMNKVKNFIQPKYIVFSSTPYAHPSADWDIQWGHINLKSPAEWDEFFGKFRYQRSRLTPPITEWACIYEKQF